MSTAVHNMVETLYSLCGIEKKITDERAESEWERKAKHRRLHRHDRTEEAFLFNHYMFDSNTRTVHHGLSMPALRLSGPRTIMAEKYSSVSGFP